MRKLTALIAAAASCATTVALARENLVHNDVKLLSSASRVLETLASDTADGMPHELLENAHCILVFPGVAKDAFFVGGKQGRGIATCRADALSDRWSPPSFFKLGGTSFGWRFDGRSADLVLFVMNDTDMSQLLDDELTFAAAAETRTQARLLSWSRARGVFTSAALEGLVVKSDEDANRRLYGRQLSSREILDGGTTHVPSATRELMAIVRDLSKRGRASAAR